MRLFQNGISQQLGPISNTSYFLLSSEGDSWYCLLLIRTRRHTRDHRLVLETIPGGAKQKSK